MVATMMHDDVVLMLHDNDGDGNDDKDGDHYYDIGDVGDVNDKAAAAVVG
jgi:hypothetical protein